MAADGEEITHSKIICIKISGQWKSGSSI
jgi:hypothetical protein